MTFEKNDPNINRNGRPKAFDAIRTLSRAIAEEQAIDYKGNKMEWAGKPVTNVEFILRSWIFDRNHQKDFVEAAYGKVPNPVEIAGPDGESLNPYMSISAEQLIEIAKKIADAAND